MKIYINVIAAFLLLIIFTSCVKEVMINPDPSFTMTFQHDGKTDASAGDPFYVIPTGSGEFLTLYDGTPGYVYGEVGAKGTDFNKRDSMLVQYNDAGKYKITVVASSAGNFGKDYNSVVNTVEVDVIDARNSFSGFFINGVAGEITTDNEIRFSVPDAVTDLNFKAVFVCASPLSTVFVNGVKQVSDTTVNNFAQPVVYTVKSDVGTEKTYTVKFTLTPSSSEKKISKFKLGIGGNGEVGVIDEDNKTITVASNYGTNLASVRLVLEYSYSSKVLINGITPYSDRTNYNLVATVKTLKVVAQDKSEVIYSLVTTSEPPVSQFTFAGLIPAPVGIINTTAKTITIDVLKGTDVTKLTAQWTGSIGKVTIGSVIQSNGVTVNNFTTPLTYTFYKGSTAGDKFVVTVIQK